MSGEPLITLEGDGPIVERFYTGTAFVASEDGLLLTNRHVAIPWRDDESAQALIQQGLVPVAQRFVGYLAGIKQSFDVELVVASDDADVAVLRCSGVTGVAKPLTLSETIPQPGDEVIVMGYPTGIRALLARADEDFVHEIMSEGEPDFWNVARRLSETGRIAPLATRGIVGQVTAAAVVYDAETTSGGSGGPVIGLNGEVVAVNTAILPEFGGSNLGVPVKHAGELLASAREK
jgi:S1-C subfamily serine protease